jgi:hypothetical protein
VQIKPGFDPLKAQVHLDLHRLARQFVELWPEVGDGVMG